MSRLSFCRWLPLVIALWLLAGCSSFNDEQTVDPVYQEDLLSAVNVDSIGPIMADANSRLVKSAQSIDESLVKLFELEAAAHPHLKLPPEIDAKKAGLADRVTVNWVGPVQNLLKAFTKKIHYKFAILGKEPAVPVLVSIRARYQTVAEVLRNIKYQSARYADVVIYPKTKTIELRYINMASPPKLPQKHDDTDL